MRVNKWTLGLAACGLVSLPTLVQAEEKLSALQTALSSTTISGYVNTSVNWNMGTGNANVPGFAYNNGKQDGFNLDVVKLTIERPLDEGQWSAGYKVDTVWGPDANALGTQSTGVGADFGIKQAYVALRAPVGNGLDIKLGVWDTIVGYETFDSGSNPNYTRSYGYTIEPTTHTGLLLTYQFSHMLGFSAGIANTYGPTINQKAWANGRAESFYTYMGSVAFSAPKDWGFVGGSTLYAGIINGINPGANSTIGNGAARETHYYLGGALTTPVKGLKLGASYDYAAFDEFGAIPDADAWAAALYASFQPEGTKFGVHLRGEYASHTPGAAGPGSGFGTSLGSATAGSQNLLFPAKVFALTGTVQYDLWKNVLSRLEARWDHDATSGGFFGGSPGTATTTPTPGTKKNSFMLV